MEGTILCSANYVPLSPISFLERSAIVYKDRVSIVYGDLITYTWEQTFQRCVKLASALTNIGVSCGDVVASMAPNVPAMYELNFGVPMAGAILCPINARLNVDHISKMLKLTEAKVLFVDYQFFDIAKEALKKCLSNSDHTSVPTVILIQDIGQLSVTTLEYESFLETGKLDYEIRRPKDECEPISITFTSGTTSAPKGVVYTHRGAYLNSLASILLNEMSPLPVYLWTVPMFHCNGWCLAWGVAAQGGINICLRDDYTSKVIFDSIYRHNVTHLGGAPCVLNMIVNTPESDKRQLPGKVVVLTGGAPPPPEVLLKMERIGFNVTHAYGMTEVYGPATVCTWKQEWSKLSLDEQAKLKARQGVKHLLMEQVDVKDPVSMKSVKADGKTIGEVMLRGNTVMNGYFKNEEATKSAFEGGWYHTGDLGVIHSDDYIEIKDRSVDIIISDGQYISSVDIESVLFSHPAVLEAAVVGKSDDLLGETACAFVKLKDGFSNVTSEEIIRFCKDHLTPFMVPKTIVFEDLPKTSTGKTQKYTLKEKAKVICRTPTNVA